MTEPQQFQVRERATSAARRTTRGAASALGTWVRAVLAAGFLTLGLGVALAPSSAAHGGDVEILLGTDGAGGFSVILQWQNDGHPVEESADVVVVATNEEGEEVGPLRLQSASEGRGWYVSEPGLLALGNWELTATITTPQEATASTRVDVLEPHVPERTDEPGDAPEATSGTTADDAAGGPWVAVAIGAAVLAAAAFAVLMVRRTRRS